MPAIKELKLRRPDTCSSCQSAMPVGTQASWNATAKSVTCLPCVGTQAAPLEPIDPLDLLSAEFTQSEVVGAVPEASCPDAASAEHVDAELRPIDVGRAGASAKKEYDRRHAKHEAKIEDKWGTGRLGRIAKRLADEPQSTTAWAKGANGEQRVAEILTEKLGSRAVLLHDRKVPKTRGNIDHLAIAASGVWIIDAKRDAGKVETRDVGGLFRSDHRLYVNGRDRTKTVDGLDWQVNAVRASSATSRWRYIHRSVSLAPNGRCSSQSRFKSRESG